MNDDQLRSAYARATASRAGVPRPDCPTPEQLLALVERRGAESERVATASHVARCADCRRDVDLLRAVNATRPAMARRLVSLAAAAVILIVAGIPVVRHYAGESPVSGSTRESTRSADDISLIVPRGDTHDVRPIVLSWRSVPTALRYDVSVVGDDGATPFKLTTSDTAAAIGADVQLERGREYFWTVTAHLADGGERHGEPVSFRLTAP